MNRLSVEDRAWLEASCKASGVPVQITDERLLVDLADVLRDDVSRGSDAA